MSESQLPGAPKLRPNPILLPRFTFLIGPRVDGVLDLAKALVARDPELEPSSRLEASCEAVSVLWDGTFDQFPRLIADDPTLPTELRSLLKTVVDSLDDRLLASIAIRRAESVIDITADRLVYTDATWGFAHYFQSHWGRSSVGVISTTLQQYPDWYHGRFVVLATSSLPDRLAQLEAEFGLIQ